MRQHHHLHACALCDLSVVDMVPARASIALARLAAAEMVVHHDQHIALVSQLDQLVTQSAVARVTDGSNARIQSIRQALELRLYVLRVSRRDRPAVALDDVACVHLAHVRLRTMPRRNATARLEHIDAALMLDARAYVRVVYA